MIRQWFLGANNHDMKSRIELSTSTQIIGQILDASIEANNHGQSSVSADIYASGRIGDVQNVGKVADIIRTAETSSYLYQYYAYIYYSRHNTFLSGDVTKYTYPNAIQNHYLIYSNQLSRIYLLNRIAANTLKN